MLRRRSAAGRWGALAESWRAAERVDVVLDVARCSPAGTLARLGHESVGCRWSVAVRDCGEGLALGEGTERRARLRPWKEEGALDTSETWWEP